MTAVTEPDGSVLSAAGVPPIEPGEPLPRHRDMAAAGYDVVSRAVMGFAGHATLRQVLDYFAAERRAMAQAYRSHEANLFGVWRDERLPASQRTRTTLFGANCPPYERVADVYARMLGVGPGSSVRGVIKARLGNDVYELTSFRLDPEGGDVRGRVWLHTHWQHVRPLLNHCAELFAKALEPVPDAAAMESVAQLHWWFVHAWPFARGTTSIAEWLVSYIFRTRGVGAVRFAEDPASMALVAPNLQLYVPAFRANVQLLPGRQTIDATRTPERSLAWAARRGQKREVARLLRGLPARTTGATGYTPLHLAAYEGHTRVVKLLLSHGADMNAPLPDSGETPLHLAARAGRAAVVEVLVCRGAVVDVPDASGATALHLAVRGAHARVVRKLLRRGARLDATDALGRLPVHHAAERGLTRLCLRLGRRFPQGLRAADGRAETALSLAALRGHDKLVRALLKRGALPPPQDPQLMAIKVGHKQMQRRIVEAGVDISLYWLQSRAAERGCEATSATLRAAVLRGLPARLRKEVGSLLPAAQPRARIDWILDENFTPAQS